MLNETKVLKYIKQNLGFANMKLEMSDSDILDYIKDNTIYDFSRFFPDKQKYGLNLTLEQNKVSGEQNAFYIYEADGLEILDIVDIAYPIGDDLFFGHPYMGAMSGMDAPNFILQSEIARTGKKFSIWDYKFEFESPNIFRIRPVPNGMTTIIVMYERVQPPDFSKIPNEFQRVFLDLCLADIMMTIGRIRKRYGGGNLRTPFGEIPIGSEIFDEGKELKDKLIEKMENTQIPNIRVSIG